MHIPDGYLSPATFTVMYAAAAPFWYVAAQKLKTVLTSRMVPLLAVFSAFSFVIMMFNIPLPGGTTAHMVGGTLMAIVLGPWAAIIGISVVLIIQALLFGDGGITAIGANCFNIAIALPLAGYYVYQLIGGGSALDSRRRTIAAAAGAYVGINIAALLTAIELGIQPLLFRAADGTPLYAPYSLEVAIPAMMLEHILLIGVAEAVITGMALVYLRRAHIPIMARTKKVEEALA